MPQLQSVVSFLDRLLETERFGVDTSMNGLQVEAADKNIRKVAVAVDAGLSVIDRAIEAEADLLIVHHGLFWSKPFTVQGVLAKKLSSCFKHKLSIYASHLPLDAHLELGNAACLARLLKLGSIEPCFEYSGLMIGVKAKAERRPISYFQQELAALSNNTTLLTLPFGKTEIETVGIVTGSGSFAIQAVVKSGLDLYVSGEPKHEVFHLCKELNQSAIFAGHYATETFGVRAVGQRLEKDLDLEIVFIDEPSGV